MTGAELRAVRERVGESKETFAKRFGVSRPTIINWERKGPPADGPARALIERVLLELGGGNGKQDATALHDVRRQ